MTARLAMIIVLSLPYLLPAAVGAQTLEGGEWPANQPLPVPRPSTEIWNGTNSSNRLVAAIEYADAQNVPRICSGLVIAGNFVLTAAHCTCHRHTYLVSINDNVLDGNASWHTADLRAQFTPNVCQTGKAAGDDLAILELRQAFVLEEADSCSGFSLTNNIRLASKTFEQEKPMTVAGFGLDGRIPGSTGQRRSASVPMRSAFCTANLFRSLGCRPFKEFMLGNLEPKKVMACGGDSGGPVFRIENGHLLPIGVVSRSAFFPSRSYLRTSCGSVGIYTHLGRLDVKRWIEQVTGGKEGTDCGIVK